MHPRHPMHQRRSQKRVTVFTHIYGVPLPQPVPALHLVGGLLVALGLLCLLGPSPFMALLLCPIGGLMIGAGPST